MTYFLSVDGLGKYELAATSRQDAIQEAKDEIFDLCKVTNMDSIPYNVLDGDKKLFQVLEDVLTKEELDDILLEGALGKPEEAN